MKGEISNFSQIAYIRRYTLNGGNEDGLHVIEIDNGNIRFLLNESKTLDIMQLWHQGINISFVSKNGFTNREIPFIRRFEGGMLYTCGLDSVGGREGFELHGNIHNTPAKIVECFIDENTIRVKAEICTTELFGQNLLLERTISTDINGDCVTVSDKLKNLFYKSINYCLLYHINIGYPMISDGTEIVLNALEITPRTEWARKNIDKMLKITKPIPGEEESCYFIKLNEKKARVINKTLGKEFELKYSGESLDEFVEWRSMACGDYALGLEPSTTKLDEGFTYKSIEPNASIETTVLLTIKNL